MYICTNNIPKNTRAYMYLNKYIQFSKSKYKNVHTCTLVQVDIILQLLVQGDIETFMYTCTRRNNC